MNAKNENVPKFVDLLTNQEYCSFNIIINVIIIMIIIFEAFIAACAAKQHPFPTILYQNIVIFMFMGSVHECHCFLLIFFSFEKNSSLNRYIIIIKLVLLLRPSRHCLFHFQQHTFFLGKNSYRNFCTKCALISYNKDRFF